MPSEQTPAVRVYEIPEAMHDLVTTVAAPACALASPDGQLRPGGVQGLYVSDARVLHGARIIIDAVEPVGLGWAHTGPGATTFYGFASDLGDESPDPTVRVDRTRTVCPGGLDETIRVHSAASVPVRTTLELHLTPDLTPLIAARLGQVGPPVDVIVTAGACAWDRDGVAVRVAADGVDIDPGTLAARWPIELAAGTEITLHWSVRVHDQVSLLVPATGSPPWSPQRPRADVDAADPRLDRLMHRALDDLASLRLAERATPDLAFIAAGAPWFLTLFGRDSIWAARMMLPMGTDLAETTLRALAGHQGVRVAPHSGEEPGKILHEVRRSDPRLGAVSRPRTGPALYYGTVDATPLWISLLADAWRHGMAEPIVASLLPNLRRALRWLAEHSDPTGSGFISYLDKSGHGLANQGWKDSSTAIRFRDGATAAAPIALCEVQGYAHRAALDAVDLLDAFGSPDAEADYWRAYAARLADRFRKSFWVQGPLGAHPALALDRDGGKVDALTSNIGHLLGTGLLDRSEESLVARILGVPALASGYGLRTMSTIDAAYDPLSYHCGSIWPHDTAIALLGLATMAGDPDARATTETLADGLLGAAEAFGYRLPELFSGDARADVDRPLPHPAACRPQAWSATAAIALIATIGARAAR
jgi:hypothetical protein